MLLKTALKAYISSTFGNYADRREMEAALSRDSPEDQVSDDERYASEEEIWIDFMSDTGDGFKATYSMAKLLAADFLDVNIEGTNERLPRGRILLLGGDQIYPSPTAKLYEQKFQVPFASAFPEDSLKHGEQIPHLYAIPGNHDWYDGLGNFMKIFCQQRTIGAWQTIQRKSYFAIKLMHNYWIWAIDVQLNADIDKPQLDYFKCIGERMKEGEKIVLITAEPSWVYQQIYKKDDNSYDRLKYFIEHYIICKNFQLKTILSGDLHHYSHYVCMGDSFCNHLIGAGGGGAFMHFTHNLPSFIDLPLPVAKDIQPNVSNSIEANLKACYPRQEQSKKLNRQNLLFVALNSSFCCMMGIFYLFFFWIFETRPIAVHDLNDIYNGIHFSFAELTGTFLKMIRIPAICILTILIGLGFYSFADFRVGKIKTRIAGFLHASVQLSLIYFTIAFLSMNLINDQAHIVQYLIAAFIIFCSGWVVAGVTMGLYLFSTNLFLKMHLDESSSSIAWTGYKNFLRMKITKDGLTIYPIGVRKISKWKMKVEDSKISFSGQLPDIELIEGKISITN
ncbi:MAG: metallophosphoesterase [Chitinophagaceae bacterium]|nr:metallophosphoesterase [Chitinophagaceae bacterium]